MRWSRFSMVRVALVLVALVMVGAVVGCTADDKPGPRTAGGGDGLTEEQRANLARYGKLRGLAVRFMEEKRFSEAQVKVNQALLLAGQIHGADHPLRAQTIALRGRIFMAMERFDLAVDSFRAELQVWRRALTPGDNVVFADCLHRLGVALHRAGQTAAALETLKKAVAMKRATLDDGPRRLGKHYRDATQPPRQPSLAASLHALARVLWARKAYDTALATFRRALALQRKHLPAAHPALAKTLADVAVCHETLGQYNLAAQRLGELVTRLRKGGAATASALPSALKRLGDMTLRAGRAATAEKHYLEARRLAAAATSLPHREAFDAELDSRLAILYARTNRTARAEPLLRRALAVFEKNTKAHADPVVRCLIQLAKLQRAAGKLAEATGTVRRALNVVRKHQGHRTYAYARALAELAEVYAAQKANEQAARILARAFEIVHKLYGGKHPRTARLRARLVELYTALGWKEQLKELPR